MKRTKIVCTIGPATESKEIIEKLIKGGMNVARLNFSHGTYEHHEKLIKNIREIAQKLEMPVAIMQDLQGPRIRVGKLPEEGVKLKPKTVITLTTNLKKKESSKIPVTYTELHKDLKAKDKILLVDGLIELEVLKITGKDIITRVIRGGLITSHKGINLPVTTIALSSITEKDKKDLYFGVKQKVDLVALSFVTSAKDVYDLRYLIKEYEKKLEIKNETPIQIICKIEKHEAVKNFNEILEATDGIMVARGDLGIEMPPQDVPLIQKGLIDKCLKKAKPVIVATQMLDSMIRNPRPTRAEVSDVANAVIDHTDAVMLSGETATGRYPAESVEIMTKIIKKTEKSVYDDLEARKFFKKIIAVDVAISNVANILATSIKAKAILVASLTGYTGRVVSRYRPELPILVATSNERVQRQLNLSWGVVPFVLPTCRSVEELIDRSIGYIKKKKIAKKGDKIIIIAGQPVGRSGNVNLVKIHEI